MSVIYLIRHGQASFGAKEYDELSALGSEQAAILGAALAQRGAAPGLILSGCMRRHRQTAESCLRAMGLPAVWEEDEGWNEYDHNDVLAALNPSYRTQGGIAADLAAMSNPRDAFQTIFAKAVARWTEGAHDADYRETWVAFNARVEAALKRLCGRLDPMQSALVFTSGGVVSAVTRKLLSLPDEQAFRLNWSVVNGSLTKLVVNAGEPRLSTLNEHGHFEGKLSAQGHRLITYR